MFSWLVVTCNCKHLLDSFLCRGSRHIPAGAISRQVSCDTQWRGRRMGMARLM